MGSAKKAGGSISSASKKVGGVIGGNSTEDRLKGAAMGGLAGFQAGGPYGAVAGAVAGGAVGGDNIQKAVGGLTGGLTPKAPGASTIQKTDTSGIANAADTSALGTELAKQQKALAARKGPAPVVAQTINRAAAGNVAAQNVGPMTAVNVDRGAIANAQAGQIGSALAANINTTQADQMRAQQMNLGQQLQAQADGTAPSIAELQARRAGDRAMAQTMSQQAGQVGPQAALGRREAGRGLQSIGANIAADSAVLRLQEQQGAQKALGDLSGQVRGQDIGLATSQAEMQQGTNLANLQAQSSQVEADLKANLANQGMDFETVKANAAAGNSAALANLQALTQNADRQLQAAMANQNVNLDVLKQNAAAGNQIAMANLDAALTKLGLDDAMKKAYLQNQVDIKKIGVDASLGMAGIASTESMAQANLNQQAALAKAAGQNQMIGGLMQGGAALGAAYIASDENLKTNITKDKSDDDEKKKKDRKEKLAKALSVYNEKPAENVGDGFASIGKALASVVATKKDAPASPTPVASDEKLKKNTSEGGSRLEDFLGSLDVFSYDYKDEKHGEGRQTSVMAQDLEKSDIGKKAIVETEEGKIVNYTKLLPAMLSANVDANKRIMKLEDALKAMKGKN